MNPEEWRRPLAGPRRASLATSLLRHRLKRRLDRTEATKVGHGVSPGSCLVDAGDGARRDPVRGSKGQTARSTLVDEERDGRERPAQNRCRRGFPTTAPLIDTLTTMSDAVTFSPVGDLGPDEDTSVLPKSLMIDIGPKSLIALKGLEAISTPTYIAFTRSATSFSLKTPPSAPRGPGARPTLPGAALSSRSACP